VMLIIYWIATSIIIGTDDSPTAALGNDRNGLCTTVVE